MLTPRPNLKTPKASPSRHLHGRLAILTGDVRGLSTLQRQQLRDELGTWLATRKLHLGGDLPVAIVYCPASESTQLSGSWRALHRWLATHLARGHRLDEVTIDGGLPASLHWAALDAIAGAQIALAETSQLCAWDLQQIASRAMPRVKSAPAPAGG